MNAWIRGLTSSVGLKFLVGLTGLLLFAFVIVHLTGNLSLWAGREKMNAYAAMLHGLGPLIWVARLGLLAVFLVHVAGALTLARRNLAARPVAYGKKTPMRSTVASRTMVLTGLSTLGFVIFHLLHFTIGKVQPQSFAKANLDAVGRPDVWGMVVADFQVPAIALAYALFMVVLGFHLVHGVASAFQSFGWVRPRYREFIRLAATGLVAVVILGNIVLPLSVLSGAVKDEGPIAQVAQAVKETR